MKAARKLILTAHKYSKVKPTLGITRIYYLRVKELVTFLHKHNKISGIFRVHIFIMLL